MMFSAAEACVHGEVYPRQYDADESTKQEQHARTLFDLFRPPTIAFSIHQTPKFVLPVAYRSVVKCGWVRISQVKPPKYVSDASKN